MSEGAREVAPPRAAGSDANDARRGEGRDSADDVLRTGYCFREASSPEDTWTSIWEKVRGALAERGDTAVNIRSIHRVDPSDKRSRWKRQQMVCKCSGLNKAKKIDDVERRRKSHSSKTNCPFKVTISWPRTGPPIITQVVLEHNKECNASSRQAAREQCVSTETLERECSDDVRQWTVAGLRKTDMFRLLNARYSPLRLGEEGRRKVRNMAAKVERELLALDGLKGDWGGGETAEGLEIDVTGDSDDPKGPEDRPRGALREKLLFNLQGIANREAARLCANLGPRLTPEMAVAVFQGLKLQVDALISGSGVIAGPMRPAGMAQLAASPGASGLPVVGIPQIAPGVGTPCALSPGSEAGGGPSPRASQVPPEAVARTSLPGTARAPTATMLHTPAMVPQVSSGDGVQESREKNDARGESHDGDTRVETGS